MVASVTAMGVGRKQLGSGSQGPAGTDFRPVTGYKFKRASWARGSIMLGLSSDVLKL